jgi:hypothetical protein
MIRTHPHADATYEVVSLADGGFGVKISIPDIYPTTVSSFDTVGAAEAWIGERKTRVGPNRNAAWFFVEAGDSPT